MLCALCEKICFKIFCKDCANRLRRSRLIIRPLGDIEVISLFPYSLAKYAIAPKHSMRGWLLLRALCAIARHKCPNLNAPLLACENAYYDAYSHTYLIKRMLDPSQDAGTLLDFSKHIYKGRSLSFRQHHPRRFIYTPPKINPPSSVVILDDLITTGTTIKAALKTLKKAKISVRYALCLADAEL